MARISRFLLGGAVGAGLALLFAPKPGREMRRMLLGGGRKALPASGEAGYAPSGLAARESAAAQAPAAPDLEARIEQTRQQVEAQIEEAFTPKVETVAEEAAPPAEAEPEAIVEEAVEETVEEVPPAVPVEEIVEAMPAEAAQEAVAEEPVAEAAPVEEAAAEATPQAEPVEEEIPAGEAVTGEAPAGEEAGGGWEALGTPAAGEPTLEAELTVSTGPEETAAPAPSGIDREEMRRRIDETRARLKAKAFDAMVSGETFIDETEAEKAAHHEETAPEGIDSEAGEQIDERLREQD